MTTINYQFADGHFEKIEVTEEFKREYEFLLVQEKAYYYKIKKQKQRAKLAVKYDLSLDKLCEDGYEQSSKEPNPLEVLIKEEERQAYFAKLLTPLTDKQRKVYILYYLKQLTQTQIANRLGISVSSVNERLQNAKKRIIDYFLQNPKI